MKIQVSYSAAIESAAQADTDEVLSPFAARVVREATRRGVDRAARRVVLGDGAKWIWHLADEHVPEAVQIVDRFQVKQHLSDVAKSLYGATSDLAHPWARTRHDELDAGDLDAVLTALREHAPHDDEARQCIDSVERNRARMDYPGVPSGRTVHLNGGRGGRLSGGDRHAVQARRDAWDRRRRGRDHRPALLQAERPLRGLLGAPRSAAGGRMTTPHLTILTCTQVEVPDITGNTLKRVVATLITT